MLEAFRRRQGKCKAGFFQDNKKKGYTEKDFRFTYKNGFIYAFQMKPAKGNLVKMKSFKRVNEDMIIKSVKLLGEDKELLFERNKKCMEIHLHDKVQTDLPICFKLEIK